MGAESAPPPTFLGLRTFQPEKNFTGPYKKKRVYYQLTSVWRRVIHNSIKLSNQRTYWPQYMFIYIMLKNTALGPIGFTQSLAWWFKVAQSDQKKWKVTTLRKKITNCSKVRYEGSIMFLYPHPNIFRVK